MTTATTGTDQPLSAAELTQLRRMLEQQRGFRIEQLAQLAGSPGPLGSSVDEIALSLATGARAALHDVEDALERMAQGRYGRCTCCSATLGRSRLEILPQVALCMSCQRAAQTSVGAPTSVRTA